MASTVVMARPHSETGENAAGASPRSSGPSSSPKPTTPSLPHPPPVRISGSRRHGVSPSPSPSPSPNADTSANANVNANANPNFIANASADVNADVDADVNVDANTSTNAGTNADANGSASANGSVSGNVNGNVSSGASGDVSGLFNHQAGTPSMDGGPENGVDRVENGEDDVQPEDGSVAGYTERASPTHRHRASLLRVGRPRLPPSIAFLTVGQRFCGSQTVNVSSRRPSDEWRVKCCIQGVDLERGTVCGSMEALDVPKAASPVITFWEGEVVDNRNNFFLTRRWGAGAMTDLAHWKKFAPFAELRDRVERDGGDDIDLSGSRYVFMRWKEQFFVNCDAKDCGLTIQGFYYLCLDRHKGCLLAYYYDPRSEPFQRLQLMAMSEPEGYSFASIAMA